MTAVDRAWVEGGDPAWIGTVRRADLQKRKPLRELAISLDALRRAQRWTGDTAAVFELLGNFPGLDLLRRRPAALVSDPRFLSRHAERRRPALDKRTVVGFLDLYPAGSVGHSYAEYLVAMKLDDMHGALGHLDDADPAQFLAKLYLGLHDFLHWLLGFPPFEPIGETEIESFLYAQDGAPNHWMFVAGYVAFLVDKDPGQIPALLAANASAYLYGARAANLLLVDWEEELGQPLASVRRRLRIDERPVARAVPFPKETPKLAHAVLSVADVEQAAGWFGDIFRYTVSVRDRKLGLLATTAGDDHHTIAFQPVPTLAPSKLVPSLRQNLARALEMRRARGVRSPRSGRPVSFPPLSVIWSALRPGVQHLGFRVASEADLESYHLLLKCHGVPVEWACSHMDATKSLYVFAPGNVLCELFVDLDTEETRALREKAEAVGGVANMAPTELVGDTYALSADDLRCA